MDAERRMQQLDRLFSHVWMVRTFLKHSDEAADDEDLQEVHRTLYDVMLSLGGRLQAGDATGYLQQAKKKLGKLRRAAELFREIQPDVSGHMNFLMATQSLSFAVEQIHELLQGSSVTDLADPPD